MDADDYCKDGKGSVRARQSPGVQANPLACTLASVVARRLRPTHCYIMGMSACRHAPVWAWKGPYSC